MVDSFSHVKLLQKRSKNAPHLTKGIVSGHICIQGWWFGAYCGCCSADFGPRQGASIYDVRKIFGILDSPLVRIWDWSTILNSHNLPYYIFFWANSPSLLSADVIYGCPLSLRISWTTTKICPKGWRLLALRAYTINGFYTRNYRVDGRPP